MDTQQIPTRPVKRLELVCQNQLSQRVIHSESMSFDVRSVEMEIRKVLEIYVRKQLPMPKKRLCKVCEKQKPELAALCREVFGQ